MSNNNFLKSLFEKKYWVLEDELLNEINIKYKEPDNEELYEIFVDEGYANYEDARIFLYGSCDLFAIALHRKFGYKMFKLENNSHFFCESTYNDITIYIDVRGMTLNYDSLIAPFIHDGSTKKIEYIDNCEMSESEKFGFEFANQIIDDYYSRYNVNNIFKFLK